MRATLMILSLVLLSGCMATARVDYRPYQAFASDNAGNKGYDEIQSITVKKYGPYGIFCESIAKTALDEAHAKAKSLGGNGLINVRWYYGNRAYPQPVCSRLFLLYYWHTKAVLSATVIKR